MASAVMANELTMTAMPRRLAAVIMPSQGQRAKNIAWIGMRLGWGLFLLPPRTKAARVPGAGVHSTLHGVVFAIFCAGPAVHG